VITEADGKQPSADQDEDELIEHPGSGSEVESFEASKESLGAAVHAIHHQTQAPECDCADHLRWTCGYPGRNDKQCGCKGGQTKPKGQDVPEQVRDSRLCIRLISCSRGLTHCVGTETKIREPHEHCPIGQDGSVLAVALHAEVTNDKN